MESLATSLSLLLFLFFLEKNNSQGVAKVLYSQEYIDQLNSTYFEPMVQTLMAGQSTLDEQLESQPEAAHEAIHVKKNSLETLMQQIAQAKERLVISAN